MRLDFIITQNFGTSREKAKYLIENEKVLLNGQIQKKPSTKVLETDKIELTEEIKPIPSSLIPSDVKLDVIFEDEFLIIINKQAGIATHPASIYGSDTIANGIAKLVEGTGIRAGIVHRLDKETTGLLIIAKTEEAKTQLSEMMERREIERRYIALCFGNVNLNQFKIEANIERDLRNRLKMKISKTSGKKAVTNVMVKERILNNMFSLLELKLETGRTHQIRLHLSHHGNAIVGDQVYGVKPPSFFARFSPEMKEKLESTKRQMLHAFSLEFTHPFTGEKMKFEAPKPKDFEELLEVLKRKI